MTEFDSHDVLNEQRPHRPRHAALHSAIRRCSLGEVQELLAQGADIEAPDLQNRRALHLACSIADGYEIVKLLLEKGVKVDSLSMDGFSALHTACCSPASKATVNLLLAKDTNRKALLKLKTKEKTALLLAIEHQREDLTAVLLDHGAVVSPACLEAAGGNDAIKSLLEKSSTIASPGEEEDSKKSTSVSPEREEGNNNNKKRPRDDVK
tara:strand:+ start:21 stop:647 length:627 start_codon:yes stop_codon:yes gene_type:complete